tara:strand:- start:286 stop:546 length:261 start_codon:yes stop_codon:yes gene_type:complete
LRPGNIHSADGWEDMLCPVLARYPAEAKPSIIRRRFRADAAFAIPALFDLLEAESWGLPQQSSTLPQPGLEFSGFGQTHGLGAVLI